MSTKIAIAGLGWFGLPLAHALRQSAQVCGTKSTREGAVDATLQGIPATRMVFENGKVIIDQPALFDGTTCAVINIPPGRGDVGNAGGYTGAIRELVGFFEKLGTQHIVFVSSTGVFGESQLDVNEHTTPEPTTDSGRVLLACEIWLKDTWPGRWSILRPAGLIGGSRHPGRFLAGKKQLNGRLQPVNLVHRDDLVSMAIAIIQGDQGSRIWHAVGSGHPTREAYYTWAALTLGLEPPLFIQTDNSPGRLVHGEESKQVLNLTFKHDDPYEML